MSEITSRLSTALADRYKIERGLFAPTPIAPLVYFRILFGAIMLWEVTRYYSHDWIERFYIDPDFFAAWVFRITCWASLIQQLTPSNSLLRGNRSIFLRTPISHPFMASLGDWKKPKNPFAKY